MNFYEAMKRAFDAGERHERTGSGDSNRIAPPFEIWFAAQFGKTDVQQHLRIESIEIKITRDVESMDAFFDRMKRGTLISGDDA